MCSGVLLMENLKMGREENTNLASLVIKQEGTTNWFLLTGAVHVQLVWNMWSVTSIGDN